MAPFSVGAILAPFSVGAILAPFSVGAILAPFSKSKIARRRFGPTAMSSHPVDNWIRYMDPGQLVGQSSLSK